MGSQNCDQISPLLTQRPILSSEGAYSHYDYIFCSFISEKEPFLLLTSDPWDSLIESS